MELLQIIGARCLNVCNDNIEPRVLTLLPTHFVQEVTISAIYVHNKVYGN